MVLASRLLFASVIFGVLFSLGYVQCRAQSEDYHEMARILYDAPECDLIKPSLSCIEKIMPPVQFAGGLPLDKEKIARAITPFGPYVASEWQLTTLHRLPLKPPIVSQEACAFQETTFFDRPEFLPGCGNFLFIGGHPKILNCPRKQAPFLCIDLIPATERPDIGLRQAEKRKEFLETAVMNLETGDEVFLVHQPLFDWLPSEDRMKKVEAGLRMSKAVVLFQKGTTAALLAATFQGSSGGTVLDNRGKVVGILAARAKGQPVVFMQVLTPQMVESIGKGRAQTSDSTL